MVYVNNHIGGNTEVSRLPVFFCGVKVISFDKNMEFNIFALQKLVLGRL